MITRPLVFLSALTILLGSASVAGAVHHEREGTTPSYSPGANEDFPRQLLWGDTHLHTNLSPDANMFGNKSLGPDDAFRFASGDEVTAENGMRVRLRRPLDFLVVTDHAEYMGVNLALAKGDPTLLSTATGRRWATWLQQGRDGVLKWLGEFGDSILTNRDMIEDPAFRQSIWQHVVEAADRNDRPGLFSAFIGYEWTTTSGGDNLHRVVIFRDGATIAGRTTPFSSFDSTRPEDLWNYLADYEDKTGGQVLAVPHNSNISGGLMFRIEDSSGQPLSKAYAAARARWEPLVEVTQYKGDSETHPYLSPEDEFADYETWDKGNFMQKHHQDDWYKHEYVRSALRLGLQEQGRIGINPFKLGMIGSTDSHTSLATADEDDFWGKFANHEPAPDRYKRGMAEGMEGAAFTIEEWQMAASGYAAVWARENTRAAIFDAMRRRETYATTGPRIAVRFFGGWEFDDDDANAPDVAAVGYAKGVPMGGELADAPDGDEPVFLIRAAKDPDGANLDRLQIVKGWLDAAGETHEKVYDVALSDGRKRSFLTRKIPRVGSTVDVEEATYSNEIGDAELGVVWEDPEFDRGQPAFYYVRVIEIPTPRWTAFDQRFFEIEMPDEVPMTTQERAYTSPIWYTP